METASSLEERQQQAAALPSLLNIDLPESYRRFLIESGSANVNRLPVFGLPISPDLDSVWGATEFLRVARADLEPDLLVIRFMDTRALCLDLRGGSSTDAPLAEVDLEGTDPPRRVHDSFKRYMEEGGRSERQIDGALRRIRWHLDSAERTSTRYDHAAGGALPRGHEWRVRRSCIHDRVVGLVASRHNEDFDGLEVDVFVSTDHPDYEPGHGVRALTSLLLSEAYRNGATMAIHFTRYDANSGRRVADRIPSSLLSLASDFGITFRDATEGIISHAEAVQLYGSIVGLSAEVARAVHQHEGTGRLTLQALCYLISARIWTVEEASWILLNCPRPEGVLFGADVPEDRLSYMESVSYGRAALAATRLRHRLQIDDRGEERECRVSVVGPTWLFERAWACTLDWTPSARPIPVDSGDTLELLPRPRPVLPGEKERIWNDVEALASCSNRSTRKAILYSEDSHSVDGITELADKAREARGVDILVAPFKCRELDGEVDTRMRRARVLREPFEASPGVKEVPLLLVPVRSEQWKSPAVALAVEQARGAARRIRKKVDIRRERTRYTLACEHIESIVLGQPDALCFEVAGSQARAVIESFPFGGVAPFPFVGPPDIKEVKTRLPEHISARVNITGALLAIASPFANPYVPPPDVAADEGTRPTDRCTANPPLPDIELDRSADEATLRRTHRQIQRAVESGGTMGWIRHEVFTEAIREYLFVKEQPTGVKVVQVPKAVPDEEGIARRAGQPWYRFLKAFLPFLLPKGVPTKSVLVDEEMTVELPIEPAWIRIAFRDGSKGAALPLLCLLPVDRPVGLPVLRASLMSCRHFEIDQYVDVCILRNSEMSRGDDVSIAEQEQMAFDQASTLLRGCIEKMGGLELHLYHTGLEPAVIGTYRAIVEALRSPGVRGRLVVVSKAYRGDDRYVDLKAWY